MTGDFSNPFRVNVQHICHCGNFSTGPWHVYLSLERPMFSIFGIAKTIPEAGFKKVRNMRLYLARGLWDWKRVQLSFSNDKYIWHAAYEFEKDVQLFVFKWKIYLARGLMRWKKICSQMTNIFGTNRNGKFQMACILDIWLYNHDFKVSKKTFCPVYLALGLATNLFLFRPLKITASPRKFLSISLPFFSRGHRKG